ncbi:hypothetical protein Tco_0660435 [Tanacetum coccineum]
MENLSPQSSPQVLPSFEVYTPHVTYPEEVEETLGTPMEEEPLDQTKLEDVGLTNHNISLISREVPSTDEPKPQPDYALEFGTRILNMVPNKKVDKTPYELWYGKVPNLSYLKVWGCEALVKRDTPDKLQQRVVKCIFVGYPKETMGYYFYFPLEYKIVVAGGMREFLWRYLNISRSNKEGRKT